MQLNESALANPELSDDLLVNELTIIGIAGIKDPLRPEIPLAVQRCKNAGVTVRMITGDVKHTAIAIAKDAGILDANFDLSKNEYDVMDGKEFREFVCSALFSSLGFLLSCSAGRKCIQLCAALFAPRSSEQCAAARKFF